MRCVAGMSDAHSVLLPFAFQPVHIRPSTGFYNLAEKLGSPE